MSVPIKKKIIIIDDEPMIPSMIKELIEEEEPGLEITAIVTDREQFLWQVSENLFDAALVDIAVGEKEGGLDILRTLKDRGFNFPVIILSAHDEVSFASKCLGLGAAGYVNKGYICSDLILGLKKVLSGELFVSGRDGDLIVKEYRRSMQSSPF